MKKRILLFSTTVVLLLSSCIKEAIYNTPFPENGMLALNIEWQNLHPTDNTPSQYASYADNIETIHYESGEIIVVEQEENKEVLVYNLPSGITIDSGIARLNSTTRATSYTLAPDHLYYDIVQLRVPIDSFQIVDFATIRGTVSLSFTLSYDQSELENITSTRVELTGIATSRNLLTGELISQGDLVQDYTFDAAESSLTLNYNILGTVGDEQILRFIFETTTGQEFVSVANVSQIVANVNSSMLSVSATANLALPMDIELEANGTGIGGITDWEHEYETPEGGTAN